MSYAESTPLPPIEFDIARKRQFEKKKTNIGQRLRSEAFVPAKPELVCAIRIRSITDNLGWSLLTLRRNVLHFKKVSDILCVIRRQASLVASRSSWNKEEEGKKSGERHERHKSDPSLEIRSNSRSCITWQKEHPRRDDRC